LRSIIGKRQIWAALAALVCVAAAALALPRLLPPATAGQRALAASEGLNRYVFDLEFLPEETALTVSLTLDYANHTGGSVQDLILRTWAGAYRSEETSPAAIDELFDACYPQGFSPGGIEVTEARWNDQAVEAVFEDTAQTVLRVPVGELPAGSGGQLTLQCRLTVPNCAHRFGFSKGVWQFGNALPILSVWQDGAWRTDAYFPIGDPFFSECANYSVTLTAPSDFLCAATGVRRGQKTADGKQVITLEAEAVREFSFSLSDQWQKATARVNGIAVESYAFTREAAQRAAGYARKVLREYGSLYGDYPYAGLTLCAVDFPFGGMEYPGLIFAGLPYYGEEWADSLELLIAHEAAHQWFYALVGSDQVNEPWQDEALCEYALLRYVRSVYGQSAYENLVLTRVDAPMKERIPQRVTPGSPISYFGSLDVYSAVVYGRGAALLLAVEEMTGKTDAFLKAYCDAFAFQIASREDFITLLNRVTQEDMEPLAADYLDTLMQ